MASAGGIGPVRAWYVVGLLCLLSVISYLDRYVIALLAEPIGQAMQADDTQIGLLMGLGFGVLYSLIGVPVAHLLDTRSRVRIVAVSVVIWSVSTCASAFAPNFGWLALFRAGVAIGEAALTPAAVSLIADCFARDRRTLPTSVFMAIAALMGSGAFIIGGAAFRVAQGMELAAGMEAWRLTMLFVGVPGLLVAPLWLCTVTEPRRGGSGDGEDQPLPMRDAIAYFMANLRLYGFLFLGLCASSIANFSYMTWSATILRRSFGTPLGEAGLAFGSASLIGGAGAALLWPVIHAWFARRGRGDVIILLVGSGFLMGGLSLTAYRFVGDVPTVLLLATVANLGFSVSGTPSVLAIQAVAPARLRARLIALYVMAISLVGFTVGPPLGAALGTHLFSGPDALRNGVALVAMLMFPVAVLSALASYPAYRRALEQARD
ncbi:MAG: MFS transporter [Sphingobium sp.]